MHTRAIWNDYAPETTFRVLTRDITTDVAIIGGGVTGISTARKLAEKGLKVTVLESLKIGGGTSGHSTGNLYFTIDTNLGKLNDKYNSEVVKQVVVSRSAALDQMEKWVNEFQIDCDFKRQPWYLYSGIAENDKQIEKEFKYAKDAGIAVDWAEEASFPLKISKALAVQNQAQFNAKRYVLELATAIQSENLSVYENTKVRKVEEQNEKVILTTSGGTVTARYAVHATHTPKGIKPVQTVLGPYREYGIACRANDTNFPEGIFWGYHENGKKFSTRLYERNGERFVLVVGEPHKVGQAEDNQQKIKNLENFAKEHFGLTDVAYRWGGQHYRPADLLPYIGRESKSSNTFIATGFSTDGLVWGTLAGMMIADDIAGIKNRWADLYNAHRFTPAKSAKKFVKENINVAGQYLKDIPGKKDAPDFDAIEPGTGGVVKKDGEKIAAYKNENGEVFLMSAVCTHMKCIVHWNNAEKTWDCPCHATRFKPDGTVIEGPAYHALHKIKFEDGKIKKLEQG